MQRDDGITTLNIIRADQKDFQYTAVRMEVDNHSLNRLNFVTLDSIDVDYVPSIKNVRHAADDIYSAKPLDYDTGILKPKGVINVERIRSQRRGYWSLTWNSIFGGMTDQGFPSKFTDLGVLPLDPK
ncbi:hypothetical protein [Xenorhabdus koppenhoeferi]|uniref:Uncharacterized protein n=1 Tax=Xenorhabdus koppenhoeferi TaxID=351659 RepID=A0A1I7JAD3_9GAMM|nr:hypothetical protein [Xenorhabdus koppenhoeferi]SFU82156.1 hypothetical protein SAMN05421784_12920 [Xenorhabdus koppenhoeferi]